MANTHDMFEINDHTVVLTESINKQQWTKIFDKF